uniref:Cadherin N-terminal domain-containing protein n=1 Tax=Cyprinus carpio TaxID=7962 RepID=A0A8C1Y4Z6_CYPCA
MALTEGHILNVWIFFSVFLRFGIFTDGQIVYSITEEVNSGTAVGNLSKDFNLNLQDIERRGFQIVSETNRKYFDLNVKTGILLNFSCSVLLIQMLAYSCLFLPKLIYSLSTKV